MKKGKSLTDLATEIERRQELKHDLIAPMAKLEVIVFDTGEPAWWHICPKGMSITVSIIWRTTRLPSSSRFPPLTTIVCWQRAEALGAEHQCMVVESTAH